MALRWAASLLLLLGLAAPAAAQDGAVTDPANDSLANCDLTATPGPGVAPAMDIVEASATIEKDRLSFRITTRDEIAAYFDSEPPSAAFVIDVEPRKGERVSIIDEIHQGVRRTYVDPGAFSEWARAVIDRTYERKSITVIVTEIPTPSYDWTWGLSAFNIPTDDRFFCDRLGIGPDGTARLPFVTAPQPTPSPTPTQAPTPSATPATTVVSSPAPTAVETPLPTAAATPAPTVATPAPATPVATPAPATPGGPIDATTVGLGLLGVLTVAGVAGMAGARLQNPPAPGPGQTEAKPDCDELRRRCDEARRAAEAAEQAARDARARADRGRADCDAARGRRAEAEAALRAAEGDVPDESSWVEGGGRRITTHDLRLKSAASQAAWDAYQRGDLSAQQLEAEWRRLGEEGALEEMRRRDDEAREARQAKARADAEAAREGEKAACAGAERAAADATAAEQAAAEARARAEEACRAADECEKQKREEEAAAAAAAAGGATGTAAGPAGGDGPPGGPGTTATGPGPDTPGTEQRREEAHHCCPGGVWAGYGLTTGGMFFIGGYESLVCELYCVADPSKSVTLKATLWRWGIGLGGEAAGTAIVVWGQDHADAAGEAMKGILSGIDGDFSVGIPFAKAAKAGKKGWEVYRLLKRFAELKKAGGAVTKEAVKELVVGAGKGTARSLGGQTATNVISGAESVAPGGVVIPFGPGLQAGLWWKPGGTVEITSIECCTCD